jgi:hypothetical protein
VVESVAVVEPAGNQPGQRPDELMAAVVPVALVGSAALDQPENASKAGRAGSCRTFGQVARD